MFCHLCGRCFKLVFEGAAWVLDQKPDRRREVILRKDILSSTEEQQKWSHQRPELARAVSWKAFSLRRNFKNRMQGISWAWPLFPILYKSPVCHRVHAGAAVCKQGALTLKRDPSPPPVTLQMQTGMRISPPLFSQVRTPDSCLAKRCECQLFPGKPVTWARQLGTAVPQGSTAVGTT